MDEMQINCHTSPWHGMRVALPPIAPNECTLCMVLTEWVNAETPWLATYNAEWDHVVIDSPYRPRAKHLEGEGVQIDLANDFDAADPQFFEQLKERLLADWHTYHRIRRH